MSIFAKTYMKVYQYMMGEKKDKRFARYYVHFFAAGWFLIIIYFFVGTLLYILGISFEDSGVEIAYISNFIEFAEMIVTLILYLMMAKLVIYMDSGLGNLFDR